MNLEVQRKYLFIDTYENDNDQKKMIGDKK